MYFETMQRAFAHAVETGEIARVRQTFSFLDLSKQTDLSLFVTYMKLFPERTYRKWKLIGTSSSCCGGHKVVKLAQEH